MFSKCFISKTAWQLRFAMAVAKKDARIYFLKPPVLIFGIFFPFCLFYTFTFGRNISPAILLPGLLGMTLFFIASSATPIIAPWETLSRTLERLVATPASIAAIISGDILAGFLYGISVCFLPLSFGVFVLGLDILSPAVLTITIVLSAICFSAMGSLLSTLPTDFPGNTMLLSNAVRLPLIFISGVFIPIEGMPGWAKVISAFSPLTYTCDLARHTLSGYGYYPIPLGLSVLSAFTIAFFTISIQLHYRSMSRRLA